MRNALGDIQLAIGLGLPVTRGRYLFVNNNSVGGYAAAVGSDGGDGSFERPLATIAKAQTLTLTGRHDVIVPMWGHAESVATATALGFATAGVTIFGMPIKDAIGRQIAPLDYMPKITLTTATTAVLAITAQTVLANLRIVCDFDAIVKMISVSAAGAGTVLQGLCFDAPTTNKNPLTWALLAADCDDFVIEDCWTRGLGNEEASASKVAVISFADCNDYKIRRCDFRGDHATATILNTVVGLRGLISDCHLSNTNATGDKIISMAATSTGIIEYIRGRVGDGAIAGTASIDPGDMIMHEVKVANADSVYTTYPGTVAS